MTRGHRTGLQRAPPSQGVSENPGDGSSRCSAGLKSGAVRLYLHKAGQRLNDPHHSGGKKSEPRGIQEVSETRRFPKRMKHRHKSECIHVLILLTSIDRRPTDMV